VGRGGKNNVYTKAQKYWHLSKALGDQTAKVSEGNWWLKFAPLNIAQNCMG